MALDFESLEKLTKESKKIDFEFNLDVKLVWKDPPKNKKEEVIRGLIQEKINVAVSEFKKNKYKVFGIIHQLIER